MGPSAPKRAVEKPLPSEVTERAATGARYYHTEHFEIG